jgi:hypothetical protein
MNGYGMSKIIVLNANSKNPVDINQAAANSNQIYIILQPKNRDKFKDIPLFQTFESKANEIFQSNAKTLKKQFNLQMDDISKGLDIKWQATRTSESNVLVNDFYRNIVLCQTVEDLIVDGTNNLLITDSNELIYVYTNNRLKKYLIMTTVNMGQMYRMFKNILKFILHYVSYKVISLTLPKINSDILIHTFPEFKKGEKYQEIYFPGVKEFYEENQKTVSFVLSNTGLNPRKLYKYMNSHGYSVFNEYQYYSVCDFFRTVFFYIKLSYVKNDNFVVRKGNFAGCFNISHKKYGLDFDVLLTLLRYGLFIAIERKNYKPKLLLLEFEGMIIEKMLIAGLRESQINTKVFGYQHMAVFENMICNFFTPFQLSSNLLPDKIICSGEIYRNLYAENGIPDEKLQLGPALRYNFIHKITTTKNAPASSILVLLPFNVEDCIFLVNIIGQNLNQATNYIRFKPHVKSNKRDMLSIVTNSKLQLDYRPIQKSLADFSIVISMNSGALLDAALSGKYVIKFKKPFFIDLDPLFANKDLRMEVNSDLELKAAINKIRDNPELSTRDFKELKSKYFNHVTSKSMEVFLP